MSLDGNPPMVDGGGEYDLGLGSAEALQLADEMIQIGGGMEDNFDEHGIIPCDTVALDDVGDAFDIGVEFLLLNRFHLQIDKSLDMKIHDLRIDAGGITQNYPVLLQPVDTGRNRRRRQEDLICDLL